MAGWSDEEVRFPFRGVILIIYLETAEFSGKIQCWGLTYGPAVSAIFYRCWIGGIRDKHT